MGIVFGGKKKMLNIFKSYIFLIKLNCLKLNYLNKKNDMDTLFDNEPEKLLKIILEKFQKLGEDHKTNKINIYNLRYFNGTSCYELDLNKIVFTASNHYELWLKIYYYFQKNVDKKYYDSYFNHMDVIFNGENTIDTLQYYYDNTENPNDDDAIMKVIDSQIDDLMNGDTLWCEPIDKYI